ncbi:MAG: formate/nitrite transporter family protein, partial [Caldisericia bacterium]|nr:formate/nitrite transporter family protein [Caldisericia bacterium]
GNNLIIISLLKKEIKILDLIKNWGIVYIGNLFGSIFYAYLIYISKIYTYNSFSWGIKAITIAYNKVNLNFIDGFSKGILCNILVCLAVLIAIGSKSYVSKIFSIYFPIMAFVASGFEHSVANMYFIPMGIFLKSDKNLINLINFDISNLNFLNFLIKNLIPVTLGNIFGGAILIGILYYLAYLKE